MKIRKPGGNQLLASAAMIAVLVGLRAGLETWSSLSNVAIWVAALIGGVAAATAVQGLTSSRK